jgi:hypothetical protein
VKGESRQQVLFVANSDNGEILYDELLLDWFEQLLIDHTLFAAGVAGLGAMRVHSEVETVDDAAGTIVGWRTTLSTEDRRIVFRRLWPASVLRSTAQAVAAQCRSLVGQIQVVYWAARCDAGQGSEPAGNRIEFDEADGDANGLAITPTLPVLDLPATGTVVSDCFPNDLVLTLSPDAYAQLIRPIRDGTSAACEIAWAAAVCVARSREDQTLIYQVPSLKRIVSRNASAGRVPMEAADLLAAVSFEEPLLLLHTHTVPAEEKDRLPYLACSWDDLRCMYRLRAGSLFGIVSGRPPLELRIYGFQDGHVREMNARVIVTNGKEGGLDGAQA